MLNSTFSNISCIFSSSDSAAKRCSSCNSASLRSRSACSSSIRASSLAAPTSSMWSFTMECDLKGAFCFSSSLYIFLSMIKEQGSSVQCSYLSTVMNTAANMSTPAKNNTPDHTDHPVRKYAAPKTKPAQPPNRVIVTAQPTGFLYQGSGRWHSSICMS